MMRKGGKLYQIQAASNPVRLAKHNYGPLEAVGVPLSEFMLLTKVPIIIFYGDNIPEN